jgi:hypothetical protein
MPVPASNPEPTKQTSVFLPASLHRRCRLTAAKHNTTFRDLVATGLEMACDHLDVSCDPEAE